MFLLAHCLVFLVFLMVVSEDVEGRVDEEFGEFGLEGIPVFSSLFDDPGLGEDDLSDHLCSGEIAEIVEVVE